MCVLGKYDGPNGDKGKLFFLLPTRQDIRDGGKETLASPSYKYGVPGREKMLMTNGLEGLLLEIRLWP